MKHPAKYNDAIIRAMSSTVARYVAEQDRQWGWTKRGERIKLLDPMAGVGRCHELITRHWIVGGELEMPWARQGVDERGGVMIQHDASNMPSASNTFHCVFFSPDYGNRMADSHNARDGSKRHTYTHYAREQGWELRPETTCKQPWGRTYYGPHAKIMRDVDRVLVEGGVCVVNVKNFVKAGEVVNVVGWYRSVMSGMLGMNVREVRDVETTGLRHGQNYDARVAGEVLIVGVKEPF